MDEYNIIIANILILPHLLTIIVVHYSLDMYIVVAFYEQV